MFNPIYFTDVNPLTKNEDKKILKEINLTIQKKDFILGKAVQSFEKKFSKLAKSTQGSDGATLYATCSPCMECSKLIIQCGITRVVYGEKYRNDDGLKLLKKAGIGIQFINEGA